MKIFSVFGSAVKNQGCGNPQPIVYVCFFVGGWENHQNSEWRPGTNSANNNFKVSKFVETSEEKRFHSKKSPCRVSLELRLLFSHRVWNECRPETPQTGMMFEHISQFGDNKTLAMCVEINNSPRNHSGFHGVRETPQTVPTRTAQTI